MCSVLCFISQTQQLAMYVPLMMRVLYLLHPTSIYSPLILRFELFVSTLSHNCVCCSIYSTTLHHVYVSNIVLTHYFLQVIVYQTHFLTCNTYNAMYIYILQCSYTTLSSIQSTIMHHMYVSNNVFNTFLRIPLT